MAINKNYKVEVLDNTFVTAGKTNITEFVISLDDFSIESTGILSTAKIVLNAEFGAFLT